MATLQQMVKALQADKTIAERCEGDCGHDEPYMSVYLGSALSLDPCGRYHHILSPNGATARCERYWKRLEKACEQAGGWLESGEGDALDQYFCFPCDKPTLCPVCQDSDCETKSDRCGQNGTNA